MDFRSDLGTGRIIIFDGGMGTQLEKRGLELSGPMNNITHPEMVQAVHSDYAASGAHVLISNTFTMNPVYIASHQLSVGLEEVNRSGVELAKKAASSGQLVFGDMGPTGQMLAPFGTFSEDDFFRSYRKQAVVLLAAGVDGFIIETMYDLNEALTALRACRDLSSLPVIVSFSLSTKAGQTMMGQSLLDCAQAVAEAGGDAVGANCGDLDPGELADVVAAIHGKIPLPIIVQPNAGKPKLAGGKTVYDMTPDVFAEGVLKCVQAGAQLVGGCCGTTPDHIRAVAELLNGM